MDWTKKTTVELDLDELYMVIGALLYLAIGLEKGSEASYAHCQKALVYRELAKKMDVRFVALHSDLSLAIETPPKPTDAVAEKLTRPRAGRKEK